VGVEGDPVDDGSDKARVGEHCAPFAERQICPDRDGGSFLPFGDDLEQQLGAAGVELNVTQLVEQEQVQAAVAADDPGQLPVVGGFGELVDQLGGRGVADPAALLASGQPEADQQMRLAGAGVTEQDDRLTGVDPRSSGQRGEGGRDAGDGVGVEVGQPLEAGELRFGDAAGLAAAGAVVGLGGQDLGEVAQVRLPFPDRDLGEPGSISADGRQFGLAVSSAIRGIMRAL
jgi:hypothetical protein